MTTSHTGCDERAACDCLYHHWRHHYCPKRRHPGHVCGAASCRPCGCRHRRQAAGPPSSNPGLGRRLGDSAPSLSLSPRDQTSARYVIFCACGSQHAGSLVVSLSCQREKRCEDLALSHHGNHDTHISCIFQFAAQLLLPLLNATRSAIPSAIFPLVMSSSCFLLLACFACCRAPAIGNRTNHRDQKPPPHAHHEILH